MKLIAPPSMDIHVKKVLDGEYEVPYEFNPQVIVDCGANVGAFVCWAKFTYPSATIHAYEPMPDNFKLLVKNCARLKDVHLYNKAVTLSEMTEMFVGKHNCGEASFHDIGGQTLEKVKVTTVSPVELPLCNFLKVDTEGCEIEILTSYLAIHKPAVVAFEFHSAQDRKDLDALLDERYTLFGGEIYGIDRGTLKYVRSDTLTIA